MRTCTKCETEQPLENFYFSKRHNVLLGFLRDDPDEIYLVSEYLEKRNYS